jgi:Fe-S cluster biogenesis protein NfuA
MSLKEEIQKVIEEDIKPRIQMDGGDIRFIDFTEDNIVYIILEGACVGCPASGITLKMGIEKYLKLKFPEVQAVEQQLA